MSVRFYEVIDRECVNPALSYNGGDYAFWRVVAVEGDNPIAISYRTSSDFLFCSYCGDFGHPESKCWRAGAEPSEADGWESGRLLIGEEAEREARFFAGEGWFNPIR